MDLRGELALTHVKLPMCLALIDPIGDLSIPAFDRFASSALAELERAHGVVWKGRMEGVIGSPRFDATFAASQDATGQDETDGPRTEDRP
jgi:hypothetical protein